MRTVTGKSCVRLVIVALLVTSAGGIAVVGATLATGGGVHQVELQGVPQEEFRALGARLLEPNAEPLVSADQAVATAMQNKFEGDVRETRLVRLVNDSASPKVDSLAWAINFDTTTVRRFPSFGGGPLNQSDEPKPPTSSSTCGAHLKYDIVFVNALTGEWLFEVQQSGDVEPNEDGTCPATPVVPAPPPPTQVPGAETAPPTTN